MDAHGTLGDDLLDDPGVEVADVDAESHVGVLLDTLMQLRPWAADDPKGVVFPLVPQRPDRRAVRGQLPGERSRQEVIDFFFRHGEIFHGHSLSLREAKRQPTTWRER